MIEQITFDLPHADADTNPPVSIYLVHLSSAWNRLYSITYAEPPAEYWLSRG